MEIGLTYIRQGDIIKAKDWIHKNRSWTEVKSKDIQDTAIHIAIKTHQHEIIDYMLDQLTNVDLTNSLGDTLLHTACNENLGIYAQKLIIKGADLEHRETREGSTPLHRATEKGYLDIVKLLLSYGANLESTNNQGETPIHIAAELNYKEILDLLISSHSDVNSADFQGNTPLHKGCRANNTVIYIQDIIKQLLNQDAHRNIQNTRNETALSVCIKHGSLECLQILVEFGAEIKESDVKFSRETGKSTIWKYLSKCYQDKHHSYDPESDTESRFSSPNSTLKQLNERIRTIEKERDEALNIIQKLKEEINDTTSTQANSNCSTASIYTIENKEIELKEKVGQGEFGDVFKAVWKLTEVAVKVFKVDDISDFKSELEIVKRMRHPNIVQYLGVCNSTPMMVMEFMLLGSLRNVLHDSRHNLNLKSCLCMGLNIARGMYFLHTHDPPILHRDLKSANCLVDSSYTVKLCDFGLARLKECSIKDSKLIGTPQYMAPEVIKDQIYSIKSDVYSFGILLWEIITRRKAFEGMQTMALAFNVVHSVSYI